MNAVEAIGASAPRQGSGMSGLTSDEFFRLIFTELSNQDPMKPNDTSALLEQIANIRSIQADEDLSDRLGAMLGQNDLASGSGLIGRLVSGVSEANERVSGVVHSVSKTEDGVVLNLDGGARVRMDNVDKVLRDEQGGSGEGQDDQESGS